MEKIHNNKIKGAVLLIIIAKKNELEAETEQLTSGTVGLKLKVSLSHEWDDLAVTAVFSAGNINRDVAVTGSEITIPWELFRVSGRKLKVNLHGALPDGTIVISTNIVSLGLILPSSAPSGAEPEAPSPTRADEIQSIAEAALASAESVRNDADSGMFDGFSPSAAVSSSEGYTTITITDKSGTTTATIHEPSIPDILDSPAFTGIPTAPTPASGTNTTQLATTEFVNTAVANAITNAIGGSY